MGAPKELDDGAGVLFCSMRASTAGGNWGTAGSSVSVSYPDVSDPRNGIKDRGFERYLKDM